MDAFYIIMLQMQPDQYHTWEELFLYEKQKCNKITLLLITVANWEVINWNRDIATSTYLCTVWKVGKNQYSSTLSLSRPHRTDNSLLTY